MLHSTNPYFVQTGIEYPYYHEHWLQWFREELIRFKPTWEHDFSEFDYMADNLSNNGHNRTKRFVQECKALQDKARKNQLDANQVNQFRNQMDEFFINNDRGTLRHYGHPDHDLHDRSLWRLAKAAVALYEHLKDTHTPLP